MLWHYGNAEPEFGVMQARLRFALSTATGGRVGAGVVVGSDCILFSLLVVVVTPSLPVVWLMLLPLMVVFGASGLFFVAMARSHAVPYHAMPSFRCAG